MLDLAKLLILEDLPTGVIVGSAIIENVTRGDNLYQWHLSGIEPIDRLRKPMNHPLTASF